MYSTAAVTICHFCAGFVARLRFVAGGKGAMVGVVGTHRVSRNEKGRIGPLLVVHRRVVHDLLLGMGHRLKPREPAVRH